MLIVGLQAVEAALKRHAAARKPMERWIELTESAQWQCILDVRGTFPHADAIKGTILTCFNIGGGNFRLLTVIDYSRQLVRVRELLTHGEYDKKYVR